MRSPHEGSWSHLRTAMPALLAATRCVPLPMPAPTVTDPPAASGKRSTGDARAGLDAAVAEAWRCYQRAVALGVAVAPAAPVLFFGDLDAYLLSPLRMLTVGLNPSLREFPAEDPLRRFPSARRETQQYLDTLSGYFWTDPYTRWFRHFEPLLNGAGASYWPHAASAVLHTDICSSVATDPTWSGLNDTHQQALAADGVPLWHALVTVLQPRVVVVSVARQYLQRISFEPLRRWQQVCVFERTGGGEPRRRAYEVTARWHVVGAEPALVVFCPAGRNPLIISDNQKRQLGEIVARQAAAGPNNHPAA